MTGAGRADVSSPGAGRAAAFGGLSRLAKHRAVNDALKAEFASGLHALHIDAA